MRIEKASRSERDRYEGDNALHGWITVHGHRCVIEKLNEKKTNPQYEAIAPDGHHFDNGGALHTMLAFDHADLLERMKHTTVETCDCEVAN